MRFLSAFTAMLVLMGCADSPVPVEKKKTVEVPAAPITGRQAFQAVYGSARLWSADSQPLTIRSTQLAEVKSEPGKASAWEVVFVSPSMARARSYTWSAAETEGWHKGVFAGQQSAWSPGAERLFSAAAIKIDTTEALEAAIKTSSEYLEKPGKRPPISFQMQDAGRLQVPVWYVLWGGTISSAEYSVMVDAATGKVVGKS